MNLCFSLRIIAAALVFFLTLLACRPTRVRIEPGRPPPPYRPSPVEPAPAKPAPAESPVPGPAPSEMPRKESAPPDRSHAKGYEETLAAWKSFQDVQKWMETEFSLDMERFRRFEKTLPAPYPPEETFRRRSGIYIDSALFIKEALNRIKPSYKARVAVIILRPYGSNHYVCTLMKDGRHYIMDYGTPYREITGLHGPFGSLDEYKRYFEKKSPFKKRVEGVRFLQ